MLKLILTLIITYLIQSSYQSSEEDLVTYLPNVNFTVNFKHFSGYLNVGDEKYLHYWFTESESNPKFDPVILWLNGGPGCSSLLGLLSELGPFHVENDGNMVYKNEYSWNKFANVIFLESPAGVGFSYVNDSQYTRNDDTTAEENHQALITFFKKFPEYKNNDLYIAGESYGGIYLPTLAVKLIDDKENFSSFKGVAIGNGLLDRELNIATEYEYFYYHGIISEHLHKKLIQYCCNNDPNGCIIDPSNDAQCSYYESMIEGSHFPYNIYDDCNIFDDPIDSKFKESDDKVPEYCHLDKHFKAYLRRDDVRNALHIPSFVNRFKSCSDEVRSHYHITYSNVKKEYLYMIKNGIRILTYNGDFDVVCNFLMNQRFLEGLELDIVDGYDGVLWHVNNGEISGGYWSKYVNNVDFLIIRGAGHMVPKDKPEAALQMIYNFINQNEYSKSYPYST